MPNSVQFLKSSSLKNTFQITYKNYPVPAGWYLFHNRDLTLRNEEYCLSGTNFHVIALSRQGGPKLRFIYICKSCKQCTSLSKFEIKSYFWMKNMTATLKSYRWNDEMLEYINWIVKIHIRQTWDNKTYIIKILQWFFQFFLKLSSLNNFFVLKVH